MIDLYLLKLSTQWGVRRALDAVRVQASVQHLIKAEAPLDADPSRWRAEISAAINTSCEQLCSDRLHAVVLEIDLKRTEKRRVLADRNAVRRWYSAAASIALESGRVEQALAYCHSPIHLVAALASEHVSGFAAQYNLAEPWPALYFDEIATHLGSFVGMSPLARGALVGVKLTPRASAGRTTEGDLLIGVRWALADPRVTAITITISSVTHLSEAITAAANPLPIMTVAETVASWSTYVELYQGAPNGVDVSTRMPDALRHAAGSGTFQEATGD